MSLPISSVPDDNQDCDNTGDKKRDNKPDERILTIALSVQAKEYPQRFLWAKDNAFALEYTPEPLSPALIPSHVKPFIEVGIPVRYHCRLFNHEMGNADIAKAEQALHIHEGIIDAITGLGDPVITVHLNLVSTMPFDVQTGIANLSRLVEYGQKRDVIVCLENLRRGAASDPHTVLSWAKTSGAMITMDIGHAVSSEIVNSGMMAVSDLVDIFHEKLHEVHIYGREEDRHDPIENITPLEAVIDRLLKTQCRWWTIELDDFEEALSTRDILTAFLKCRDGAVTIANGVNRKTKIKIKE